MPRVTSSVATTYIGTPAFQSTAHTTTSKAMGMGKSVPNAATRTRTAALGKKPSTVAICAIRVQGKSSTRTAPNRPAAAISGSEITITVQRLRA